MSEIGRGLPKEASSRTHTHSLGREPSVAKGHGRRLRRNPQSRVSPVPGYLASKESTTRVEPALLDGDTLLDRGAIVFSATQQVESFPLYRVGHKSDNAAAMVLEVNSSC
jgi:hypothetical protein